MTDISEQSYLSLQKPQLLAPEKILYGPSRQPLKTLGQFWGKFSHSVWVLSLLGLLAKTELFTSGRSFHWSLEFLLCSPTAFFCPILFLAFLRISSASSCSCCERVVMTGSPTRFVLRPSTTNTRCSASFRWGFWSAWARMVGTRENSLWALATAPEDPWTVLGKGFAQCAGAVPSWASCESRPLQV